MTGGRTSGDAHGQGSMERGSARIGTDGKREEPVEEPERPETKRPSLALACVTIPAKLHRSRLETRTLEL